MKLETTYKIFEYEHHGLGFTPEKEKGMVASVEITVSLINNLGHEEDSYTEQPINIHIIGSNSDGNKYFPMHSSNSGTLKELVENVEKSAKEHFERRKKWKDIKVQIINEIGFLNYKETDLDNN